MLQVARVAAQACSTVVPCPPFFAPALHRAHAAPVPGAVHRVAYKGRVAVRPGIPPVADARAGVEADTVLGAIVLAGKDLARRTSVSRKAFAATGGANSILVAIVRALLR